MAKKKRSAAKKETAGTKTAKKRTARKKTAGKKAATSKTTSKKLAKKTATKKKVTTRKKTAKTTQKARRTTNNPVNVATQTEDGSTAPVTRKKRSRKKARVLKRSASRAAAIQENSAVETTADVTYDPRQMTLFDGPNKLSSARYRTQKLVAAPASDNDTSGSGVAEVGKSKSPEETQLAAVSVSPTELQVDEDARKFIAFQVAEDAKQQVMTWAKWLLAVCGLIVAILGIQFGTVISQFDSKLEKAVDERVDRIIKEKTADIDRRTQQMIDQQIESLVKTRTESAKAIEGLKNAAQTNLDTLKRETAVVLTEFDKSRQEVEFRKNILIAQLTDGTLSITTTTSGGNYVRSGERKSVLFGELSPNVIGVCGAGPGEYLSDAFIGGRYGSPFAHHFLLAIENPKADSDGDNRVSIQEAVQAAHLTLKSSGQTMQNPTFDGSNTGFAFLKFLVGDAQPQSAIVGKLFALVIAVNEYSNTSRLRGCVDDARAFNTFLLKHKIAEAESVEMLLDRNATGNNIKQSLSKLIAAAGEDDVILVFYSGHLVDLPVDNQTDVTAKAICPVDLQMAKLEEQDLLQVQEMCEMLAKGKAKQNIVLIP